MNYDLAMERNKVPIHAAIWVKLKSIRLQSKKSDTKDHALMIPLIRKTESRLLAAWGWGWERGIFGNG